MTIQDDNSNPRFEPKSGWFAKFRYALNGLWCGIKSQSSFWVHLPAAIAVVCLGIILKVSSVELSVLLLCIALVITLELVNTSIESLSKAVVRDFNEHVKIALDASAAAVLVASVFSVVIGLVILLPKLLGLLGIVS
ncbi:diacylglycerol kinase family protein [bacterium]|nr:diacylglycerol kinase family protein [bacterium]